MAENQGNNNNSNTNTPREENTNTNTAPPVPIVWLRGEDAGVGAGRKTWPDLVGATAEEAEKKVKADMPRVRVQVVPPDCFVTMDYRRDRVRLFLDSTGKVARPPTIG